MKEEISFWKAIKFMKSRSFRTTCKCKFGSKEYYYQVHDNKLMYFDESKEKYTPSSLTITDALMGRWYMA